MSIFKYVYGEYRVVYYVHTVNIDNYLQEIQLLLRKEIIFSLTA